MILRERTVHHAFKSGKKEPTEEDFGLAKSLS